MKNKKDLNELKPIKGTAIVLWQIVMGKDYRPNEKDVIASISVDDCYKLAKFMVNYKVGLLDVKRGYRPNKENREDITQDVVIELAKVRNITLSNIKTKLSDAWKALDNSYYENTCRLYSQLSIDSVLEDNPNEDLEDIVRLRNFQNEIDKHLNAYLLMQVARKAGTTKKQTEVLRKVIETNSTTFYIDKDGNVDSLAKTHLRDANKRMRNYVKSNYLDRWVFAEILDEELVSSK